MMNVVIDSSIIIDALKPNPQFETDAQEILRLASTKTISGFVGANSLTDIYYVLRKAHGIAKSKEMLQKLLLILDVIGLDPMDCTKALASSTGDFEDAIVDVCAQKISADFIVSRDEDFIAENTQVKVITPSQLILTVTPRKRIPS